MANYIDVPVNVTVTFDADTGKIVEAYVDPGGLPPSGTCVWDRDEGVWDSDDGGLCILAEEFVSSQLPGPVA